MITNEQINTWRLFRQLALIGSAELLEIIAPVEELDTYSRYTESNARNYFLLKVLIEVQKAGVALDRWINYVESAIEKLNNKERNNFVELQLESLIDEQSVWQRKLVEGLVSLICFNETNHNSYYYHYFLLKDLEHYQSLKKEQRDFFFGRNLSRENAIEILMEKIRLAENSIDDISKCWYLYFKKSIDEYKKGSLLSSVRNRLLKALKIANPREKTAIGYNYEISFAETSRNIHFNPIRSDLNDTVSRFKFGIAQCGSLITSILCRSQQLSGITPKGLNKYISRINNKQISKSNPTVGIAKVGDFVLAGGLYIGEVIEIEKSIFGYESYCVKYLDERPLKEISEDWFPSFNVQLYISKDDLIDDVRRKLKDDSIRNGLKHISFSSSELSSAVRNAVIATWKLGAKSYYKRTMKEHLKKMINTKW